MNNNSKVWNAYHVFYHGDLDELIRSAVSPLTKKLLEQGIVEKFFYIRYWEGGPHIRLRFYQEKERINDSEPLIYSYINSFFQEYPSEEFSDKKMLLLQMNKLAMLENKTSNQIDIVANNSIVKEKYEQELVRYGGKVGMELAEEHFFQSSLFSIKIVESLNNQSERLSLGMKSMISYIRVINLPINEITSFLDQYATIWLRYINGNVEKLKDYFYEKYLKQKQSIDTLVLENMSNGNSLSSENFNWDFHLKQFLNQVEASWEQKEIQLNKEQLSYIDYSKKTLYLITSYIHMTSNRIGLKPQEEAYISCILSSSLKSLNGSI